MPHILLIVFWDCYHWILKIVLKKGWKPKKYVLSTPFFAKHYSRYWGFRSEQNGWKSLLWGNLHSSGVEKVNKANKHVYSMWDSEEYWGDEEWKQRYTRSERMTILDSLQGSPPWESKVWAKTWTNDMLIMEALFKWAKGNVPLILRDPKKDKPAWSVMGMCWNQCMRQEISLALLSQYSKRHIY